MLTSEREALLTECELPRGGWSDAVLRCVDEEWFDDAEASARRDLRELDILTIDPPGCTDIDDALHCIRLPNGNLEVGVHKAKEANQKSCDLYSKLYVRGQERVDTNAVVLEFIRQDKTYPGLFVYVPMLGDCYKANVCHGEDTADVNVEEGTLTVTRPGETVTYRLLD